MTVVYPRLMARLGFLKIRVLTVENPLKLKRIHHVEFFVGNAKQAAFYYRKGLGFSQVAYSGLETGQRKRTSYAMSQGKANFILTTPLTPDDPAAGVDSRSTVKRMGLNRVVIFSSRITFVSNYFVSRAPKSATACVATTSPFRPAATRL